MDDWINACQDVRAGCAMGYPACVAISRAGGDTSNLSCIQCCAKLKGTGRSNFELKPPVVGPKFSASNAKNSQPQKNVAEAEKMADIGTNH
jgi:hypothetical protein